MFTIQAIDHIVLNTTNPEKMIAFYCDILGCRIENVQADIGLTQLRAGDNIIDLLKTESQNMQTTRNLEHFCLRIHPFNYHTLKKFFQDNNVEIYRYGKRFGAQGYEWSFYLKDPEGNEIELTAAKIHNNV